MMIFIQQVLFGQSYFPAPVGGYAGSGKDLDRNDESTTVKKHATGKVVNGVFIPP